MIKRLIYCGAVTAAALLASCGGHADADDHDGHGAGGHSHDDLLQVTAYSPDYEVYAEVTPLSTGNKADVLAHLTRLGDFKPEGGGTLTVALIAGGDTVRTAVQQTAPGVYKLTLTPAKAAGGKLEFSYTAPDGTVTPAGSAPVTVYAESHKAWHQAEAAAVHSSLAVPFTKEASWKVDFATAPVEVRPMAQAVPVTARVLPAAGDRSVIVARTAGAVHYASPELTEGIAVTAGQPLFRIDGSVTADGNLGVRVAQARSDMETARAEYERLEALMADGLTTRSELTQARNAYDKAKADYDNLAGSFGSGAATATAPMAGYVTAVEVANGEYVEAGQPLATVARSRDLLIRAEVPICREPLLGSISGATLRLPHDGGVRSLDGLHGAVVSRGHSAEGNGTLLPVTFRVDNIAGLVPGAWVDMVIMAGPADEVVAVPSEALIEETGSRYVYVQLTPELFEKRQVEAGRTDGLYTELRRGVKPGERVVSRGAMLVKLAGVSGKLDAHSGHVH